MATNQAPTNQQPPSSSNISSKGPNVILIIAIIILILLVIGGGTTWYIYYRIKKAAQKITESISTSTTTSSTEAGKMPETDVAGTDLTDVPRYPNSIRTEYYQQPEGAFTDNIAYKVKAASDDILAFYKKQLPNNGWTLLESQDKILTYHKGSSQVSITIKDTVNSVTEYTIEYAPNYLAD